MYQCPSTWLQGTGMFVHTLPSWPVFRKSSWTCFNKPFGYKPVFVDFLLSLVFSFTCPWIIVSQSVCVPFCFVDSFSFTFSEMNRTFSLVVFCCISLIWFPLVATASDDSLQVRLYPFENQSEDYTKSSHFRYWYHICYRSCYHY